MQRIFSVSFYILVGLGIGWGIFGHGLGFMHPVNSGPLSAATYLTNEVRVGQGKYTNPLLECGFASGDSEKLEQLEVSRFELHDLVEKIKAEGNATEVSVYLRDLNNGPWIGVNEREQFLGASLLKVPLLIAYLKWAEEDPSILKHKIRYEKKGINIWQYFKPEDELRVGKEYTVAELLEYMVAYSDNNAAALLNSEIDPQRILETFGSLGMGLPEFNEPYPVNTKVYAGFFRVLYNASYLSKTSSEFALELLTKARFDKGISKPIPSTIHVAHKFGIRGELDSPDKQLHDCGIIYKPRNPYLLCIMTQDDDFDEMAKAIQDISTLIYEESLKNTKR